MQRERQLTKAVGKLDFKKSSKIDLTKPKFDWEVFDELEKFKWLSLGKLEFGRAWLRRT